MTTRNALELVRMHRFISIGLSLLVVLCVPQRVISDEIDWSPRFKQVHDKNYAFCWFKVYPNGNISKNEMVAAPLLPKKPGQSEDERDDCPIDSDLDKFDPNLAHDRLSGCDYVRRPCNHIPRAQRFTNCPACKGIEDQLNKAIDSDNFSPNDNYFHLEMIRLSNLLQKCEGDLCGPQEAGQQNGPSTPPEINPPLEHRVTTCPTPDCIAIQDQLNREIDKFNANPKRATQHPTERANWLRWIREFSKNLDDCESTNCPPRTGRRNGPSGSPTAPLPPNSGTDPSTPPKAPGNPVTPKTDTPATGGTPGSSDTPKPSAPAVPDVPQGSDTPKVRTSPPPAMPRNPQNGKALNSTSSNFEITLPRCVVAGEAYTGFAARASETGSEPLSDDDTIAFNGTVLDVKNGKFTMKPALNAGRIVLESTFPTMRHNGSATEGPPSIIDVFSPPTDLTPEIFSTPDITGTGVPLRVQGKGLDQLTDASLQKEDGSSVPLNESIGSSLERVYLQRVGKKVPKGDYTFVAYDKRGNLLKSPNRTSNPSISVSGPKIEKIGQPGALVITCTRDCTINLIGGEPQIALTSHTVSVKANQATSVPFTALAVGPYRVILQAVATERDIPKLVKERLHQQQDDQPYADRPNTKNSVEPAEKQKEEIKPNEPERTPDAKDRTFNSPQTLDRPTAASQDWLDQPPPSTPLPSGARWTSVQSLIEQGANDAENNATNAVKDYLSGRSSRSQLINQVTRTERDYEDALARLKKQYPRGWLQTTSADVVKLHDDTRQVKGPRTEGPSKPKDNVTDGLNDHDSGPVTKTINTDVPFPAAPDLTQHDRAAEAEDDLDFRFVKRIPQAHLPPQAHPTPPVRHFRIRHFGDLGFGCGPEDIVSDYNPDEPWDDDLDDDPQGDYGPPQYPDDAYDQGSDAVDPPTTRGDDAGHRTPIQ